MISNYRSLSSFISLYVRNLFNNKPYTSSSSAKPRSFNNFIFKLLDYSKVNDFTILGALTLLNRVKFRYPLVQSNSTQRLFFVALVISNKQLCDNAYSNSAWNKICSKFSINEINLSKCRLICCHCHLLTKYTYSGTRILKFIKI